jgi:hypothetical protein
MLRRPTIIGFLDESNLGIPVARFHSWASSIRRTRGLPEIGHSSFRYPHSEFVALRIPQPAIARKSAGRLSGASGAIFIFAE